MPKKTSHSTLHPDSGPEIQGQNECHRKRDGSFRAAEKNGFLAVLALVGMHIRIAAVRLKAIGSGLLLAKYLKRGEALGLLKPFNDGE